MANVGALRLHIFLWIETPGLIITLFNHDQPVLQVFNAPEFDSHVNILHPCNVESEEPLSAMSLVCRELVAYVGLLPRWRL